MISIKKIELKYPINMGAPTPKIIYADMNLIFLFYVDVFDLPKTTDAINERNSFNDKGLRLTQ